MLEAHGLETNDENVFIAASCKEKGIAYLKGEATTGVRKVAHKESAGEPDGYTVTIGGRAFSVVVEDGRATVNGKTYDVDIKEGIQASQNAPVDNGAGASADGIAVTAQMPGAIVRVNAAVGAAVQEGDPILTMEAMKMEVEVKSPSAGTVTAITVNQGDSVTSGQVLAYVN